MQDPPHSSRHVVAGVFVAFLGAFLLASVIHRGSVLHDTDAYYHLAIARLYAEQGVVDELPSLRFSAFRDGFGDKELGFHVFLVPFARLAEPVAAGRWALGALSAALAAAGAAIGMRAFGRWGALLPFWVVFASTEVAWRLVRLRPELLALLLFLAAAEAMRVRRPRILALVAFVFALSYTAFHAFLGLVVLAVLALRWRSERWEWELPLWATLGVGLGLVLHPHFPVNLEVWALQSVRFFLEKGSLAVGTEIRPNTTDVTLLVHLGWFAGLVALVLSSRDEPRPPDPTGDDGRSARIYAAFAAVFATLYLLMSRFSLYAVPFVTLAVVFALRARGRRWSPAPGFARDRLRLLGVVAVVLLASAPEAARQLSNYRHRTDPGPNRERIVDREALSRALPDGAKVIADWGPTATYLLWAPQARYLNALDPVFMAAPYPEAFEALQSILEGREPDVPLASKRDLDSEWLAHPWNRDPELRKRLEGDPRVELVHAGLHRLVRFRPASGFVLDWALYPAGGLESRPPAEGDPASWPVVRGPSDDRLAGMAAYVDAEAVAPSLPCLGFARLPGEGEREVELAPWGPTSVWVGGHRLLSVEDDLEARPGRPVRFRIDPSPGEMVAVVTCEGRSPERKGFSWRERTVPVSTSDSG